MTKIQTILYKLRKYLKTQNVYSTKSKEIYVSVAFSEM